MKDNRLSRPHCQWSSARPDIFLMWVWPARLSPPPPSCGGSSSGPRKPSVGRRGIIHHLPPGAWALGCCAGWQRCGWTWAAAGRFQRLLAAGQLLLAVAALPPLPSTGNHQQLLLPQRKGLVLGGGALLCPFQVGKAPHWAPVWQYNPTTCRLRGFAGLFRNTGQRKPCETIQISHVHILFLSGDRSGQAYSYALLAEPQWFCEKQLFVKKTKNCNS